MKITHHFVSWQRNKDNSIVITSDKTFSKIYLLTKDIIRIRTSFENKFPEESYVLAMTAWDDRFDDLLLGERTRVNALEPIVLEFDDKIIISGANLILNVNKKPFYIQALTPKGEVVYSDLKTRPYTQDQIGRVTHYTEIDVDKDYCYGFGEKTGALNKMRRRLVQNAKDTLGYDPEFSDPLYKHIPFYIKLNQDTRHALGFYYNNTYESVFDMAVEHSNYHHRYSYFMADGGDLDLFLLNGPTIANVVENYTNVTGKSAMLPIKALGYLGSTMYYVELAENCDKEIVNFVDKCRYDGIPIDNFHLSSGYTVDKSNKRQLFTWNNKKFSDPQAFFGAMHQRGVPATPNIKPGVLLSNPNYPDMADRGIFIGQPNNKDNPYVDYWWGGLGSFVDFTNPTARSVWTNYLNDSLFNYGVTSIWNDNCEYDSLTDREVSCDFDGEHAKLAEVKAIQPNLMAFTGRQAMLNYNPNVRPYSVNRGGFAGIQRYSQTWAGDNYTSWKTLKFNIATILGMGLSGVANNGCDIGGFWGPHPEPELFVRWVQNGVFQPRFSIHSCNTDNTVTEPWMYQDYTPLIRSAIELRYQLMPYFYSLMHDAALTGRPIMRPMVYEFQADNNTYNESVDFMLGSSLLVANIVEEGATTRKVYLPDGSSWFDYYTYKHYKGGQVIEVPVTLASIPLFIRDSAILVTSNDPAILDDGMFEHLKLTFGGESATFELYQDDGYSNNYLEGQFCTSKIEVYKQEEQTKIILTKTGKLKQSPSKFLELELINKLKGPFWVSIAGRQIVHYLHRDQFAAASEGWYYSNQKGSVEIKLPFPDKDCEVVISFAHFDLIGM